MLIWKCKSMVNCLKGTFFSTKSFKILIISSNFPWEALKTSNSFILEAKGLKVLILELLKDSSFSFGKLYSIEEN